MSQENVEFMRRYTDAFNSGGPDAVESFWSEDVEMSDPEGVPDFGRYVGKVAVRSRIESYREFGWDGRFHDPEVIDGGKEVVLVWRMAGRTPLSEVPIDAVMVFVFLIEGAKVTRMRQYLDRGDALKAVGLAG